MDHPRARMRPGEAFSRIALVLAIFCISLYHLQPTFAQKICVDGSKSRVSRKMQGFGYLYFASKHPVGRRICVDGSKSRAQRGMRMPLPYLEAALGALRFARMGTSHGVESVLQCSSEVDGSGSICLACRYAHPPASIISTLPSCLHSVC